MTTKFGTGKVSHDVLDEIKTYFSISEQVNFICSTGKLLTKKVFAVSENALKVFKGSKNFSDPYLEIEKSDLEFAFFSQSGENRYGSLIIRLKDGQRHSFDSFFEADAFEIMRIIDVKSAEEVSARKELRGKLLAEIPGLSPSGSGIKVFEGELQVNGIARPLDVSVVAEIVSNGQVLITTRPTLTRMALLSALPGTALIPGLALAKKQTHDSRTTEIVITGSNWHSTVRINPNDLNRATAVVNRINSAANAQVSPPSSSHQSQLAAPTSANQEKSLAVQLSSLNELFKSGALSESEFQAAKNKILDN